MRGRDIDIACRKPAGRLSGRDRFVKWKDFRLELANETRDYLADLRDIRGSLNYLEGWIGLGLVVLAILMVMGWALVSLGFNPYNQNVAWVMYKVGMHSCRPISNVNGVIVIVDAILLVFLTMITLGSVMNQMDRVKRGLPRNPGELILYASLMLAAGFGGIMFMRWIC